MVVTYTPSTFILITENNVDFKLEFDVDPKRKDFRFFMDDGFKEYIYPDASRKFRISLNISGLSEKKIDKLYNSIISEIIKKYKDLYTLEYILGCLFTSRNNKILNVILSNFCILNQDDHRKILSTFKTKNIDIEFSVGEIFDYMSYKPDINKPFFIDGKRTFGYWDIILKGKKELYMCKFLECFASFITYSPSTPIIVL